MSAPLVDTGLAGEMGREGKNQGQLRGRGQARASFMLFSTRVPPEQQESFRRPCASVTRLWSPGRERGTVPFKSLSRHLLSATAQTQICSAHGLTYRGVSPPQPLLSEHRGGTGSLSGVPELQPIPCRGSFRRCSKGLGHSPFLEHGEMG